MAPEEDTIKSDITTSYALIEDVVDVWLHLVTNECEFDTCIRRFFDGEDNIH
jgi:hypothetical protein